MPKQEENLIDLSSPLTLAICFMKRKFNFGQRRRIKRLSHILSTNWIGKLFLTINKPRSFKNSLCDTSFLKNIFLIEKKFRN
jgi:hypothetical protein